MKKLILAGLIVFVIVFSGCTSIPNNEDSIDEPQETTDDECSVNSDCDDNDEITFDECTGEPKACRNLLLTCDDVLGDVCKSNEYCDSEIVRTSNSPNCCVETCKTIQEPDQCDGVTCEEYCEGTTRKYFGICIRGTCDYRTQTNSEECGYEQEDPCEGITCNSYCDGTTRYYDGGCSNGECVYAHIGTNSTACGYEEPDRCDGVTCNNNEYCLNGTCVYKTCTELDGIICSGNSTCTGSTVVTQDSSSCCLDSCEEDESPEPEVCDLDNLASDISVEITSSKDSYQTGEYVDTTIRTKNSGYCTITYFTIYTYTQNGNTDSIGGRGDIIPGEEESISSRAFRVFDNQVYAYENHFLESGTYTYQVDFYACPDEEESVLGNACTPSPDSPSHEELLEAVDSLVSDTKTVTVQGESLIECEISSECTEPCVDGCKYGNGTQICDISQGKCVDCRRSNFECNSGYSCVNYQCILN